MVTDAEEVTRRACWALGRAARVEEVMAAGVEEEEGGGGGWEPPIAQAGSGS